METMKKYLTLLFTFALLVKAQGKDSPSRCEFIPNAEKTPQCNCTCKDGKDGKDGALNQKQLSSLVSIIKDLQYKVKYLEQRVATESLKNVVPFLLKLRKSGFSRRGRKARGFDIDLDPVKFFFEAYKKEEEMLKLLQKPKPVPTEPPEQFLDMLGGIRDNAPQLDIHGKVPQRFLPAGYDKFSASDIQWQAEHMAAAAACRGINKNEGHPGLHNVVLLRNAREGKTCRQLCAASWASRCEGEVSIWGTAGRGTKNGQEVGNYYNYGCDYGYNGGNEAFASPESIARNHYDGHQYYFSYCCCSFY